MMISIFTHKKHDDQWHKWFAWHPVSLFYIGSYKSLWLQVCERKYTEYYDWSGAKYGWVHRPINVPKKLK